LIVNTKENPTDLVAPLRKLVKSIAPGLPVFGVRTMKDLYEQHSVKVLQLLNGIVGSVGLIGLALSLVGLYAVVAYHVARRTREIGIRMAVGADKQQVLRLFLRQAGQMGGVGVVVGILISVAAGRALSSALAVPSFDPVLFTAVVLGLLLSALLAAFIPARRASRIDPMLAIRQD
jgi:putative ABC transport system permease protein